MAKQIRGAAFDLPPSKSLGALISAFHEGEMIPDYQLEELIKTWERVRASEAMEKGKGACEK